MEKIGNQKVQIVQNPPFEMPPNLGFERGSKKRKWGIALQSIVVWWALLAL